MGTADFKNPHPNPGIMWFSTKFTEYFLLHGLPFLSKIPLLRELPGIGGYFKVASINLPEDHYRKLQKACSKEHAFFICPNHPEFTTDWLVDKKIAGLFAPRIASWASAAIISGPLKPFWLANNIIANNGGEKAKAYSITSALRGDGVLLHPEGAVRWRGDKVFDLLPGAADMAIASSASRKTLIVPIVWKFYFNKNVQHKLHHGISDLEKKLSLCSTEGKDLGQRYYSLHENILDSQITSMGHTRKSDDPIVAAERFFYELLESLCNKLDIDSNDNVHRVIHRLYKKSRELKDKEAKGKVIELQRLVAYSHNQFLKTHFTQEEIADGIQWLRQVFLTKGYDSIRSFLPKPFGWRTLEIRVADPLLVSPNSHSEELSEVLQQSMQNTLDSLIQETQNDKYLSTNPRHAT